MLETFSRQFIVTAEQVFHQLVADFPTDDLRRAFLRERNSMSRHPAESNYDFHFRPIRGDHWDFEPPRVSADSGQQDRSNDSDTSNDKKDDNTSSSSGFSSSSSSSFNDGDNTDESSGDDESDDGGNDNQDTTASPDAAPTDPGEFPNDELVVSHDLVDYIEEHDRVLEEIRRDFEWTEASFFSQNGDNEFQHNTFHGKNTGPLDRPGEKKFCWDDSIPATPALKPS